MAVHLATGLAALHRGVGWWPALLGTRSVAQRIAAGGQYSALVPHDPWRLVTCTLLHVNAIHLVLNGLALLALGRALEVEVGRLRVLAWFCVSAVAGAATSYLVGVRQSDGASGGAFGLLCAGIALAWTRRRSLHPDDAWLFGRVFPAFLVLNVVISVAVPAIDPFAHLGGAVAGALWAALPDRPWTRSAEALLVGLFAGACAYGWLVG